MRAAGRSRATVLFTDLVASTELWARLGEQAAERLRRAHDRLLVEAVESNRGEVVKRLGGGIMATFEAASNAVTAAVAIQQSVDRHNRLAISPARLEVRIGLSSGDVTFEDADCFGRPVVEAARLCQAAGGGQILVADVVRLLAEGQNDHRFGTVGALQLKGLPGPVAAFSVDWAPAVALAVPLPPAVESAEAVRFVGRESELDRLAQAWKQAAAGERTAVLVGGEPGIGKTRLMSEAARAVHAQGAVVLYGRCEEESGVPYQPFAEALGTYVATCPASELRAQLGPLGGELSRLVPSLPAHVGRLPEPLRAEPETERYRLLEAVREFLAGISQSAPLLLLLDDLQWAAKPTHVLLRHLLRGGDPIRLLVVAAYRDSDLSPRHPLAETLADLRREQGVERLSVRGLDAAEVTALIGAAAGQELTSDDIGFARAVHAETEGNPFFVVEVLRHLAETGGVVRRGGRWTTGRPLGELGIPEGVRQVIGQRLSRLNPSSTQMLALAAVVGPEFDVGLLAAAEEVRPDTVLDALEEAERARLVVAVGGRSDRFAFAHSLVRSTVYEDIPTIRRLRLHRRIGQVVEARPDAEARLADLARHFSEAASLGEVVRAVDYARRAGDRARASLAFEEAADYYERALAALELGDEPDPVLRGDLLIALGEALTHAGDKRRREVFAAAADAARAVGDPHRLARVAVARNVMGHVSTTGAVREDIVSVVEEALVGLGPGDSVLRARLLGVLAVELTWTPDHRRRTALSQEALAMARRLGDRPTLARVLATHHQAAHDPDNLEERLAVASELVVLGNELGDPEAAFLGHLSRHEDLIEQGDVDAAAAALDAAHRLATQLRQPVFAWHVAFRHAGHAILAGRLGQAEDLILAARRMGREGGVSASGVEGVFGAQLFLLRYEQGRLDQAEGTLAALVESQPLLSSWRALLALAHLEAGHRAEAREQFELLVANDFALVLRGAAWLAPMVTLAPVAAALGDVARAELLRHRLAPYAGRSAWGNGPGSYGPVDFALGVLATTLGRYEDADRHFDASAELCERMRAPTWLARTRLEWARMLTTRAGPGDPDRGRRLAMAAEELADELGQPIVAEQARLLLAAGAG